MKRVTYPLIAVVSLFSLSSCGFFTREPAENKKMTFQQAMQDLSDGMNVLRENAPAQGKKHIGLVPTEMTAMFELTKNSKGELSVNLAAAPHGDLAKAEGGLTRSNAVTRKNQVQITFKNIYFDKDGKLRGISSSDIPGGVIIPMLRP